MDYFVSMFFMLLSSKGNFTAYYTAFYYLAEIILIYIGVSKNRFKPSDFYLFARTSVIYLSYMTFRFIFLNNLPINFFLSDCNFLVEYLLVSFLFCAVLRENT